MSRHLTLLLLPLLLVACGGEPASKAGEAAAEAAPASGDYERGPNRGRMLRDGDFAIEVTIFETNVPPQYRLYAYKDGKLIKPSEVVPTVTLKRLDGETNIFTFTPEDQYLTGSGQVTEPHSFDVEVKAQYAGKTHTWTYDSYEGRTTIPAQAAKDGGVVVENAGPVVIRETIQVMGNVAVDDNRRAQVKARFPGIVRSVQVQQGDRVKRGQTLVTVEGNDSMRTYAVTAPFDGIVLQRPTNVGDVADTNTLVEIANMSDVWVDLRAIGPDAEKITPGQQVKVSSATGGTSAEGTIETLLPLATGQTVVARVTLPNAEGRWRPGMAVSAEVTVASREVPLAVKESGLQRFRDFTVVFAQVGETYEVRMLELGARDGEFVEVLGGLKPNTPYVSEQSFLIKADVDKSGASHDH
ncbi:MULTISPECIES: efflux RND transporter periplasmic adaptor subunit [Pseudoxanthomonas]|jgi:cobalt-zinc-cadmium efflux system membrane fusion protein|uniref:Efflux RND transporter periplasmic adaptor subunit n=1 Tax=Pseudoxanthomonas mexicana TaxID=128785 RepID=A0ABX6R6I9_PSEMX|nr:MULTISPECIES: efflux RND transporter periplasmic adaptor subunit [Pseudoxanthomonas]MCA0298212.1 efflux RND transporter periplasmic adaptor subunit [Pseudomonadota bacterium]NCT69793.1 HlyD family efflux transporter periplasmic adaptor subunit [Xanthomonadaceae bacterium]KAF1728725.1 HlyD family secretion protein [Pseudoxanthomonas mexicana]KRA40013.1 cation transporter [Pseudoxanthomonas sp. Root630]MCH2093373.1 efflux RND transporter periplasmic adaptor subunit [Pseudoxanthomonas sp.]